MRHCWSNSRTNHGTRISWRPTLDIDYSTVRHHLDILVKHELVKVRTEEYGAIYAPSTETERNWKEVERIIRTVVVATS